MRGSGWFTAGAVGLIVFGAVHLLAVYEANFVPSHTPETIELDRAARASRTPMGPFEPSARDGIQILNSSYSVLLIFVGTLNLMAKGPARALDRLRPLTGVNVVFVTLLLAITVIYQFPPPMVFAGAVLVFFLVSWLRQGTRLKG